MIFAVESELMKTANDRGWERRTTNWILMQERSRKLKEEADKRGLHGEERRRFLAEKR